MFNYISNIKKLMLSASPETLGKSINNCHAEGIFSLVIAGQDNGTLTRVFIAERDIAPYEIQLHTHRYDLKLTTLTNGVKHHIALPQGYVSKNSMGNLIYIPEYKYQSPLNEGKGLEYSGMADLEINSYDLPALAMIKMQSDEIHTVSCKAGSMWIVEEGGFTDIKHSYVYGSPFVLDGLYKTPSQFQINDKWQSVMQAVKKHLLAMEMVE